MCFVRIALSTLLPSAKSAKMCQLNQTLPAGLKMMKIEINGTCGWIVRRSKCLELWHVSRHISPLSTHRSRRWGGPSSVPWRMQVYRFGCDLLIYGVVMCCLVICIYIQVVPGRAGGGSFKRKKNYIAKKEFAYRMCAR